MKEKWLIEYYDGATWKQYGFGILRTYESARDGCDRLSKAGWIVRVRKVG